MAKYELSVYGEDDEVLKRFTTEKLRWGVTMQAAKLHDAMETKSPAEQIEALNDLMKKIFVGMTDEDLEKIYIEDIYNTFRQVISSTVGKIERDNSKNA